MLEHIAPVSVDNLLPTVMGVIYYRLSSNLVDFKKYPLFLTMAQKVIFDSFLYISITQKQNTFQQQWKSLLNMRLILKRS